MSRMDFGSSLLPMGILLSLAIDATGNLLNMVKVSRKLAIWADEALSVGFGSFNDGDHTPFVLLVEASGKRHLINLQSASGAISEELLHSGRQLIQQFAGGRFYALIWDGFLTTSGKRQDAVFVEAGDSSEQAIVFGQRYKASRSGKMTKMDGPLVVSSATHLWHEAAPSEHRQ